MYPHYMPVSDERNDPSAGEGRSAPDDQVPNPRQNNASSDFSASDRPTYHRDAPHAGVSRSPCASSGGGARQLSSRPPVPQAGAHTPSEGRPKWAAQCRWCRSIEIFESEASGPHYKRLVCGNCGRCIGYQKTPGRARLAGMFILQRGPFAGKRVSEVLRTSDGRDYLRWLARSPRDPQGLMAAIALGLDHASGTGGDR
jgi:hypothetical protein